ncbi:hypothetical protein QYE76_060278 [Lolium multiflorum]|uniref:CCHC-type domain-containing protein n=1 Tax=Lolium multiflorum TaxID=4521 RepID=A0AAD8S053_LOLMU|nr:hypothetical protein QYE76_060278 [Lolium multiflorum]
MRSAPYSTPPSRPVSNVSNTKKSESAASTSGSSMSTARNRDMNCHTCGGKGHFKRDCPNRKVMIINEDNEYETGDDVDPNAPDDDDYDSDGVDAFPSEARTIVVSQRALNCFAVSDVFPEEVPAGLPPLRGIEHQIDLIPGASLPNRAPYRTNPEETKEMYKYKRYSIFSGASLLGRHHKDYLDACLEGSFTSKEVEARWDLLERIQSNTEDWENDKGKESGYVEKLPFKPLPPKGGNEEKKKKRGKKKKEVTAYPRVYEITIGNHKYVAPNDYYDNESEYDDLPMPFTYISDHDLEEHTTFDIGNLFGTDYESNDVSTIHVPSNDDIESSKLGDVVLEDPIFETFTFSENDDIISSGLDNRYRDGYDTGYNYP